MYLTSCRILPHAGMASPPPALYLDEEVSVVVAAILAARGFTAVTVRDRQRLGRSDSEQLAYAAPRVGREEHKIKRFL